MLARQRFVSAAPNWWSNLVRNPGQLALKGRMLSTENVSSANFSEEV